MENFPCNVLFCQGTDINSSIKRGELSHEQNSFDARPDDGVNPCHRSWHFRVFEHEQFEQFQTLQLTHGSFRLIALLSSNLKPLKSTIIVPGDGQGAPLDPYDEEGQDEDEEWDYLGDGYYTLQASLRTGVAWPCDEEAAPVNSHHAQERQQLRELVRQEKRAMDEEAALEARTRPTALSGPGPRVKSLSSTPRINHSTCKIPLIGSIKCEGPKDGVPTSQKKIIREQGRERQRRRDGGGGGGVKGLCPPSPP